jgi:hypothetical protein
VSVQTKKYFWADRWEGRLREGGSSIGDESVEFDDIVWKGKKENDQRFCMLKLWAILLVREAVPSTSLMSAA